MPLRQKPQVGPKVRVRVRVRPRVRVHPGVAVAAVQGLQLQQLQIQGPYIVELSKPYYSPVRFQFNLGYRLASACVGHIDYR